MQESGLNVLLIEDAESDAQLFVLAVEETHLEIRVWNVTDGPAAVDYLLGRGIYAQRRDFPLPEVVVLDLLLPTTSGAEFIAWCRQSPVCEQLPLVVLSGTPAEHKELRTALDLGVHRVYHKPSSIRDLMAIVREIYQLGLECRSGPAVGHFRQHHDHLA